MNYCIVWIIALIVFVFIEAITYQLVTIWFAFGALGALLCAMSPAPLYVQVGVFLLLSALTLLILRPLSVKYFKSKGLKTNSDSLIGERVVLTEDADNLHGKTKINGVDWTVRSDDGTLIPKGSTVTVIRIEGVKLIVKTEV